MSRNLVPRNKVTKKDLQQDIRQMNEDFAGMIRQLATQQQAHAISLQQISGLCFALADFMDGKISACPACQQYKVVDPGVTTCPDCKGALDFGPSTGAQDAAPQEECPAEGEGTGTDS